jgi:hypothetical protein
MKMLMVIHSGSQLPAIESLLDAHDVGGYTAVSHARGAGATGRLLGTRAWPGTADVLMTVVPDERVAELRQALRAWHATAAAGEHLHVLTLPVEDYF